MKITSSVNFIAIGASILLTVFILSEWQTQLNRPKERVVVVKIPPPSESGTQAAQIFWSFQEPLFSYEDFIQIHTATRLKLTEPLKVSVAKDGTVRLNAENAGSLDDLQPLRRAIAAIFLNRRDFRIVSQNGGKSMRGVTIMAPKSAKYGDVCKIVDVLKESGADPIVLQIDGLPEYRSKLFYGR